MERVETIDHYLRAQLAAERKLNHFDEPRVRPFVTISRQAGCDGRALADTMLRVFAQQEDTDTFDGWQIYDRTLCEIVAQDERFTASLPSLLDERYGSRRIDYRSTADRNLLVDRVFLVVRTIARMGKAIILGRGGSHVTRGMDLGVSLRLVAPLEVRVSRVKDALRLGEQDARRLVLERDADRAMLMKTHLNVDIADPTGYDMTWNAAVVSFEEIAETVAALVQRRIHARLMPEKGL
jgi:cytidylate kinase